MKNLALLRSLIAVLVLFVAGLAYSADLSPAPTNASTSYSSRYISSTSPQITDLTLRIDGGLDGGGVATDGGCAAPNGIDCRIVLPAQDVSGMSNITVYVHNAGSDAGAVTLADVRVEAGPTSSGPWAELAAGQMDVIPATDGLNIRILNNIGHVAFLRVEARASAPMTVKVWLSGFRP